MSWRCELCTKEQPKGELMRRHVVKKADGNIEREIPVCLDCQAGLKSGYSIDEVRRLVGNKASTPDALKHLPKPTEVRDSDVPVAKNVFAKKG